MHVQSAVVYVWKMESETESKSGFGQPSIASTITDEFFNVYVNIFFKHNMRIIG